MKKLKTIYIDEEINKKLKILYKNGITTEKVIIEGLNKIIEENEYLKKELK